MQSSDNHIDWDENEMNDAGSTFKYDASVLDEHLKRATITNVALIGWVGSGKSTFLRYVELKAALRTKQWDIFNATWNDIQRTRKSMEAAYSGAFPDGTRGDERFHHFYLCRPRTQGWFKPKPRLLHFLDVAGGIFDPNSNIYDLTEGVQPSDIYQQYINSCDAIIVFFDSYKIQADSNYMPAFTMILRTIIEALQTGRQQAPRTSFFCLTKLDIFPFYQWDTVEKFKRLRNDLLGFDGDRSSDLWLILERYKRQWSNSTWWPTSSIGYLDDAKTISRWNEETNKIIEPSRVEPIGVASLLEELLYRTE